MSHKATNWLASLPASAVTASEFRVLFHLCDCHNPSQGCFPTQGYLIANTNLSNGTVNNALNAIEAKGLIVRHRERDGTSKRMKPTRYQLGFEMEKAAKPSPEIGEGAVSNLGAKPSPIYGQSRLQPTGEKPVSKPVKKRAGATLAAKKDGNDTTAAEFWAGQIIAGKRIPQTAISNRIAGQIIKLGLLTVDQLRGVGVSV